ncbi:MAG: FAD-binding protein [Aggregatilineales bacterium]
MIEQKAIIIGGGMAGLFTARVLSDFFDEVVIIERDIYPEEAIWRNGVPQERHVHTLLAKGRELLEDLYPGIDAKFEALGAPLYTWGNDTHVLTTGGKVGKVKTDVYGRGLSRTLLEYVVRCRTQRIANIQFHTNTEVRQLLVEHDSVTGCMVQNRETGETQAIYADLIVDASGRYSKTSEWLADAGYPAPPETIVDPKMGYATRWYQLPEEVELEIPAVLIQPGIIPDLYRGAAAAVLENRQVVITLAGMNGDYPPTEEQAFLDYARSLPDSTVANWIETLSPVSPIAGFRAVNRLRHYGRAKYYPEHFIATGDAVCALDPIYGQGMTVALLHVNALKTLLEKSSSMEGFANRFHRKLAKVNLVPWLMAASEDRRYPLTEGDKPTMFDNLAHRYIVQLFLATPHDPVVARTLLRVLHMLQHPLYLIHPRVLWGIVRVWVKRLLKKT